MSELIIDLICDVADLVLDLFFDKKFRKDRKLRIRRHRHGTPDKIKDVNNHTDLT